MILLALLLQYAAAAGIFHFKKEFLGGHLLKRMKSVERKAF